MLAKTQPPNFRSFFSNQDLVFGLETPTAKSRLKIDMEEEEDKREREYVFRRDL